MENIPPTQTPDSSSDMSQALETSTVSDQQVQETGASTQKQDVTQEQGSQPTQKEVPFHEHPRWIERQKELEDIRTENAYLRAQAEQLLRASGQNQPFHKGIEETDPYVNMTAEEQVFYKNLEKIIDRKVGVKEKEIKQHLEERDRQLLNIRAQQFYRDHSDVKRGSLEDKLICQKVAVGYDPDDAYMLVMKDRHVQEAVETAKRQFEEKYKLKKQANGENTSIPINSQVPQGESFEDTFRRELKLG